MVHTTVLCVSTVLRTVRITMAAARASSPDVGSSIKIMEGDETLIYVTGYLDNNFPCLRCFFWKFRTISSHLMLKNKEKRSPSSAK